MPSLIVIPARLASTRLPRKLLLAETGQPLIQHTYEAARQSRLAGDICVAADHNEIAAVVRGFDGKVVMTSPTCASGTDRVAEVARLLDTYEIVVNVQGDEPELDGASIDQAIRLLHDHPEVLMATLATPIRECAKLDDPACVKVVFGHNHHALYFSRSAIPHARQWHDKLLHATPALYHQHIGLYAYRREFLLHYARMPQTPLEQLESLEQLRALENGFAIAVGVVDTPSIGIDTPADYAAFVARWKARGHSACQSTV